MTPLTVPSSTRTPSASRPTWEIAYLFPGQGTWTEGDYLALPGNRLVELSDGNVEVLPMPTEFHQMIVLFLYEMLAGWVRAQDAGKLLLAPFRVRLWPGKMREPDLMFMLKANDHRRNNEFWEGADLVMEVVSDDDRRRDLEVKRFEYAQGKIPEYWIVDPRDLKITVLKLGQERYEEHGVFGTGEKAASALLEGFEVSVRDVFAQM
jgi:Uma2 family endonuclease